MSIIAAPTPATARPRLTSSAPSGARIVRSRATIAGEFSYFVGVRLTPTNLPEAAEVADGTVVTREEALSGACVRGLSVPSDPLAVAWPGDWIVEAHGQWLSYSDRDMTRLFTGERGGALAGR